MEMHREFAIREADPSELVELGQLLVSVYASLEGFPDRDQQPRYYEMLAGIGLLAGPRTKLLVAVQGGKIIGGVVYFSDMAEYGSGGAATRERNASGLRLLAVDPAARGSGVGKALTRKCIELAREAKRAQVILHTTHAMKIAWAMYETLGFERSPDLDFMQEALPVFGFRLKLDPP